MVDNNKDDWQEVPVADQGSDDWEPVSPDADVFGKADVGAMEANRKAMLSGASFGLSDEATAGAKALYDTAFGDKKFADLLDTYREKVKQERQTLKEGKEQYPTSTTMAEIGGAILPGFATGGIGAVSNIGKVPALTSALQLGKAGAIQGGLTGFGESQEDLTQPSVETLQEVGKDIGLGGLVGGVAGATLPTVAKGGAKLAKGAAESTLDMAPKFVKKGFDAFRVAEKGIPVVGEKANKQLQSDALKTSEELLNSFRSQYKKGSEKVGQALSSGDTSVDFSNQLKNLEDTLKSSSMLPDDLAKIQKELDLYKDIAVNEKVEPGIYRAMDKMQGIINKAQAEAQALGQSTKFTNPKVVENSNLIQSLQTTTDELGQTIPKVRQVDIPEDRIIKEQVESYKTMSLSDLNNVKKELKNILNNANIDSKSKGIVSKLVEEVDTAITSNMSPEARALYEAGNKEISSTYRAGDILSELSPDNRFAQDLDIPLAQKLMNADNLKEESLQRAMGYGTEISPELGQKASELNTRLGLSKALEGEGSILGGFVNPSSMSVRTGAALGNVTNKAENLVKPVGDFTKRLIKMEDTAISNVANKLRTSGSPGATEFADKLDKILQSPKRDRLLWSISQQPAFREMVNKTEQDNQN
jgi:hypothetical protein